MKSCNTLSLVLTSATLLASATLVQAEGLTREQVKAELAEAQRKGSLISDDQTGATYRDLNPDRYPSLVAPSVKSRDQVKAELQEAQRDGTLIANEDTGATLRELAPHRFPTVPMSAGKTREQVKMELAEAMRLGDVHIDETGRTLAERFPGIYAAVRAKHALGLKPQSEEAAMSQKGSIGR
jgi:Domain of unknown function (DUF4148)